MNRWAPDMSVRISNAAAWAASQSESRLFGKDMAMRKGGRIARLATQHKTSAEVTQ